MYIAVCDDQTEELKDLTELLGAWETDRGTPVRVKSFRSAAELLDAARHERFHARRNLFRTGGREQKGGGQHNVAVFHQA